MKFFKNFFKNLFLDYEFFRDWIPNPWEIGASLDAPKLRNALCRWLGIHSPYYKYGPEQFVTWDEIKAGKEKPPIEHLGWHCRVCNRKR